MTWIVWPSAQFQRARTRSWNMWSLLCDDVNDNTKEAGKSDGEDGEPSRWVDAGSASLWRATQLNADSRESEKPLWRLEEEIRWKLEGVFFNVSNSWFHQFKARANLHNIKVTRQSLSGNFLKYFRELLLKTHVYPSRFLIWIRQGCTGRGRQPEVTSVRRKVDARL